MTDEAPSMRETFASIAMQNGALNQAAAYRIADALIPKVETVVEWALDKAGTDHPHYPERNWHMWTYPYLVSGTPMGGGVGNAMFQYAFEAVEAAMQETRS